MKYGYLIKFTSLKFEDLSKSTKREEDAYIVINEESHSKCAINGPSALYFQLIQQGV